MKNRIVAIIGNGNLGTCCSELLMNKLKDISPIVIADISDYETKPYPTPMEESKITFRENRHQSSFTTPLTRAKKRANERKKKKKKRRL